MFKLLITGIIAASLSELTGIPLFPVSPVIKNNELSYKVNQVDRVRLNEFKNYLLSF